MSHENSSTDLKRDELPPTSSASELHEEISSEKGAERETRSKGDFESTSYSTDLGSSDPSTGKPESHSVILKTYAVANRYKITLAQARRMALNTARRAQKRRERVLENEGDIEGLADRQE